METTIPLILSLGAIVLILALAWGGAVVFGVFYELSCTVLLFFAMMVTLRYWYEAARWVESVMPGAGAYGAFGAYWAVFLAGCLPLILVLNWVTHDAVRATRKSSMRYWGSSSDSSPPRSWFAA